MTQSGRGGITPPLEAERQGFNSTIAGVNGLGRALAHSAAYKGGKPRATEDGERITKLAAAVSLVNLARNDGRWLALHALG